MKEALRRFLIVIAVVWTVGFAFAGIETLHDGGIMLLAFGIATGYGIWWIAQGLKPNNDA